MDDLGPAPRSPGAWVAILFRVLAASVFTVALISQNAPWLALSVPAGAVFLVSLTRRRKGPTAPGATFTQSADLFSATGKRYPGQLSITPKQVVWMPSSWSVRHGVESEQIDLKPLPRMRLERESSLTSVVLVVGDTALTRRRFSTHGSRGLRNALEAVIANG